MKRITKDQIESVLFEGGEATIIILGEKIVKGQIQNVIFQGDTAVVSLGGLSAQLPPLDIEFEIAMTVDCCPFCGQKLDKG